MAVDRTDPSLARSVVLEIDGPGVTPDTVDAPATLELAAAFFALVQGNAAEANTTVSLRGLRVIDKCVGIAAHVDSPESVQPYVEEAKQQILGQEDAPRGLRETAERGKKALLRLPKGQSVRVLVGTKWETEIAIGEGFDVAPLDSILSIRATVMRVGGTKPAVRFSSDMEDHPFTLHTTGAQTKLLGALIYAEVDIDARVGRDAEGRIVRGRLESFEEVEGGDPMAAWREWFKSAKDNG